MRPASSSVPRAKPSGGAIAPSQTGGLAHALFLGLAGTTAILLLLSLWAIFVHAPVEQQMGIVQKIFYFHVPNAYAMYLCFTVSAVSSAVWLWKKKPAWDALAVAGAEVGLCFVTIVLITGPLWARKAWGTYWTWDPRLTTTLLAGFIFLGCVVLRSMGEAGDAERRFASGLAILGLLNLPVIHYSVQRWRGQHPTVITSRGGGLHPDMVPALLLGLALFTALAILLMWARARAERNKQELRALTMQAAEVGYLEEEE